jgi:hypothetical protein
MGGEKSTMTYAADRLTVCAWPVADAPTFKKDPSVNAALSELVSEETAGDPMSEKKWQRSSLRQLEKPMGESGHGVSHSTIGSLLKSMDYSVKANVKRLAGASHPDRDQQFEYIAQQKQLFRTEGQPI